MTGPGRRPPTAGPGRPVRSGRAGRPGGAPARAAGSSAAAQAAARITQRWASSRAHGPAPGSGRRRVRAVFIVTLFVFTLFAAQLVLLQSGLQPSGEAAQMAQTMLTRTEYLTARRGRILDRNNIELAGSITRYEVAVSQREAHKYIKVNPQTKKPEVVGVAGAAADLAPLLGKTQAEIQPLLTAPGGDPERGKGYVVLATGVTPEVWRQVRALKVPGVYSNELAGRSYPSGASTAALLGWLQRPEPGGGAKAPQAHGGGGLEAQYDEVLTGVPGLISREYSLDDRVIPLGDHDVRPAVPGRDVKLFLDRDVQWYAYNTMAEQVRTSKADWGVVVVMDRQGRLLGLSQYPAFDPQLERSKDDLLRNLALQDTFEPGSTAKVMSIGAALAERKVTPQTPFVVDYSMKRADRVFHDSHQHKTENLTVAGILAQSSNTGTIQVGEKVPAERLEKYYRAFGMGELSATRWPGETRGIMTAAKDWSGSQRYTVIFGQGLAISAIQAAGVFQTVANDGVRVPATLVEGTMQPDGTYQAQPAPQGVRVLPADVAAQLRRMLESVVGEGGTGRLAEIPGYRVAGKTGTSYIYKNGSVSGYTASFIGMAPAENPQLIVAAIVQNPRNGYYGGATAGPVFRKVMTYALTRFGIPPSIEPGMPYPLKPGEVVKPTPLNSAPALTAGRVPTGSPSTGGTATAGRSPTSPATGPTSGSSVRPETRPSTRASTGPSTRAGATAGAGSRPDGGLGNRPSSETSGVTPSARGTVASQP